MFHNRVASPMAIKTAAAIQSVTVRTPDVVAVGFALLPDRALAGVASGAGFEPLAVSRCRASEDCMEDRNGCGHVFYTHAHTTATTTSSSRGWAEGGNQAKHQRCVPH